MRDGKPYQAALGLSSATFHTHSDELCCTFPIAHNGLSELDCNLSQSITKLKKSGAACIDHLTRSAAPRRHHHESVVRGRVPVHGDRIERAFPSVAQGV